MKKIILMILITFIGIFAFNLNVEAKTATCYYNIGAGGDTYLKINVDTKGSVTGSITGAGASFMGVSGIYLSVANFTKKGTSDLFCLSQVFVQASGAGRSVAYGVTYLVTSGYNSVPLISSKSVIDNSVPSGEKDVIAIRNCTYTNVVISYMSDGTLKYTFKGAYTGYQRSAGDVTPDDFKNSCLANVYLVDSGGRGGAYVAVYKSSVGQGGTADNSGEELSGDEIEEYYKYGENSNNTDYNEQKDVIQSFCTETSKVWKIFGYLVNALKVMVPVLIIVLGSLDLGKAVVASSEDDIKKGTQVLIKRIIAGIIIFFIPTIINLIFKIVYQYSDSASGASGCIECVTTPWGC